MKPTKSSTALQPVDPSGESGQNSAKPAGIGGIIGGPEDDLTLRAALYGVLFQSYADKVWYPATFVGVRLCDKDIYTNSTRFLINVSL